MRSARQIVESINFHKREKEQCRVSIKEKAVRYHHVEHHQEMIDMYQDEYKEQFGCYF